MDNDHCQCGYIIILMWPNESERHPCVNTKITQPRVMWIFLIDTFYQCSCCCVALLCTHVMNGLWCLFFLSIQEKFWHFCHQMLGIANTAVVYRFQLFYFLLLTCAAYFSFSRQKPFASLSSLWYFWYGFFQLFISSAEWRMRHMLFLSKSTTFAHETYVHHYRVFFRTKTISGGSLSIDATTWIKTKQQYILFLCHKHFSNQFQSRSNI